MTALAQESEVDPRAVADLLLRRLRSRPEGLDDREAGSQANVLLASHAGAKLYPMVGYEQIGELMLFVPRRG